MFLKVLYACSFSDILKFILMQDLGKATNYSQFRNEENKNNGLQEFKSPH